VQDATPPIAGRAAEPGTLALLSSESPFQLKRDDLGLAVEGDGDLGSAQATGAQHGVVFQEPLVEPFPPNVTRPESCDHGIITVKGTFVPAQANRTPALPPRLARRDYLCTMMTR
jgi:hypothetical protein